MKRTAKPKKCPQCLEMFTPVYNTIGQKCCSIACATEFSRAARTKNWDKSWRKETAKRKKQLRTKTEWATLAQAQVNRYVRLRDAGRPCVSCGKPNDGSHQRHASHLRSVKAAKQLRFNLHNIHASCSQCNAAESGNLLEYRRRLVERFGSTYVEDLEGNQQLANYTVEYYERIIRIFRKKADRLLARL